MSNPYLRPGRYYPPAGSGGGYIPAPGAYFGASSGVYDPTPGSYFGYGQYGRQPGWGRGFPRMGAAHCAPMGCPPGQPGLGAEQRLGKLLNMLRNPEGQWPDMPMLNDCSVQDAAAQVVAQSQKHADALVTVYGVDSGAVLIPAGATANITVTPQKRHIPEKLVLSEAMAAAFLITGIFAGVEPVLATTGPISAAIFVQDSTSPAFKSVIMDVGMDFTVGVTNISGADARFTTTVVGKPVPPGL